MRVSRSGARHRDDEHPGEGAELGVRRPALDCSASEGWLVVELVWWWGWWFPVGWELFGFEWVVDPGAPGLVLGWAPLNRMSILRMWLRQLRSAICCVRARLTRRVSALTGR